MVYLSRTDASKSPSETARQRVHFTKGDYLEDETKKGHVLILVFVPEECSSNLRANSNID